MFLVAALQITLNTLNYHNLVCINAKSTSIAHKMFVPVWYHSPPFFVLLFTYIISLYIICPSTQTYNDFYVQLSFKSNRRKKLQTKTTFILFFIFTHVVVFIMWISCYSVISFYFNLKDLLYYFL